MLFLHRYRPILTGLACILLMIAARIAYTGNRTYIFLGWNLFLAFVPLACAHRATLAQSRSWRWIYGVLWLAFLPNATYVITDLKHLPDPGGMRYWYDLMLLYLSAACGVAMGFASLRRIVLFLRSHVPSRLLRWVAPVAMLACGYGMYLGRVERWNSWDVVAQPGSLLAAIFSHFRHPFREAEVWGMSALFAAALYVLYLMVPVYEKQHQSRAR